MLGIESFYILISVCAVVFFARWLWKYLGG